ncbi:MAG TPA: hypothetical protein VHR55_03840 [Candidatus Limnocylindria bacterium]|nr:hypothetical protein [Candidatus Limnocylindria bacterium]
MIGLDSCRSSFGRLDFSFEDTNTRLGERRLVGFAPRGRVGVVELLERDGTAKVSLLVSGSSDGAAMSWAAACVATLASWLGVDFSSWLASQIRARGLEENWSAARRFGPATVSATVFPVDAVLICVENAPGLTGGVSRPE